MIKRTVIDSNQFNSISILRDLLSKEISEILAQERPIIYLCIGTDRSTGDCLGPLVGHKLNLLVRNQILIYGNLESPIHAKNICSTCNTIKKTYNNPYIIAIDACLGNIQNVGNIVVESKPILPGSAVHKNLPPIGDLSITGVVNISGSLEFMILQNTRLFTVMHLADIISTGIYHSVIEAQNLKKHYI
jgi:putative sporulation protein YyaC